MLSFTPKKSNLSRNQKKYLFFKPFFMFYGKIDFLLSDKNGLLVLKFGNYLP